MGFLNPLAFALSALYAVLIFLHLRERHRQRTDVPSLLLWEVVQEERPRAAWPRVDLLFALQLLLLTSLIFGLARPYWSDRSSTAATRHIFVLDVSASMQVREGRATRFEEARAALRKRLARLPPHDEAMLIAAADRPRVIAPFSQNHAGLEEKLAAMQPLDTGTNLDLALVIAQTIADGTESLVRIEVFTDLPRSRLDPRWSARVDVIQFGADDDNLAIDSLQVSQGRFETPREAAVEVTVHNFSHREAHGLLRLELGDEILDRRGFSLGPRTARTFTSSGVPRPGLIRATLDVNDALAVDNVAYGSVRSVRPLRMLLLSESASLRAELERVAAATPNLDFRFGWPQSDFSTGVEDADVIILHNYVPDADPPRPTLYTHPPAGNRRFPVRGQWSELDVLDWNEEHPVLRGLQLVLPDALRSVAEVEAPAWADVLLTARREAAEIPLAFAGEHRGQRIACLAFDLAEQQLLGADHVQLLLFLLNLLDWLAPHEEDVAVVKTGSSQLINGLAEQPRAVTDPRGETVVHPEHGALQLEAPYAGEYRITADGTERRVVANLFDPMESDVGRQRQQPAESQPPHAAPARVAAPSPLGGWLFWAAGLLFLAEWLVWARKT